MLLRVRVFIEFGFASVSQVVRFALRLTEGLQRVVLHTCAERVKLPNQSEQVAGLQRSVALQGRVLSLLAGIM